MAVKAVERRSLRAGIDAKPGASHPESGRPRWGRWSKTWMMAAPKGRLVARAAEVGKEKGRQSPGKAAEEAMELAWSRRSKGRRKAAPVPWVNVTNATMKGKKKSQRPQVGPYGFLGGKNGEQFYIVEKGRRAFRTEANVTPIFRGRLRDGFGSNQMIH